LYLCHSDILQQRWSGGLVTWLRCAICQLGQHRACQV
jgi:hypothetical protein